MFLGEFFEKFKRQNRRLKFFSLASLSFLMFTLAIFLISKKTGTIFLLKVFGLHFTLETLEILSTFLIVCRIFFYVLKLGAGTRLKKILLILLKIFLVICLVFLSFVLLISSATTTYNEFSSDDSKHTLVVGETSFLLLGRINLYERLGPFFIKDLDTEVLVDDGGRPISDQAYWISREKDKFTLAFSNYNEGRWTRLEGKLGEENPKIEVEAIYSEPYVYEESSSDKDGQDLARENYTEGEEEGQRRRLDNLSPEDLKKIPSSSYGIIEADRAGAESLRYFGKEEEGQMTFISKLPDTSPSVDGKVDKEGNIYLKFEDINGNVSNYRSTDQGKNWKKLE